MMVEAHSDGPGRLVFLLVFLSFFAMFSHLVWLWYGDRGVGYIAATACGSMGRELSI